MLPFQRQNNDKDLIDKEFEAHSLEVIQELLEFIEEVKTQQLDMTILDIIIDFAFKNKLELDEIGDVISTDYYLQNYIESQCIKDKILVSDISEQLDW